MAQSFFKPDGCEKLVLAVLDSGVGIKAEDQAKLFKLFGTIDSTKKLNTKGVGLGLSITKMISKVFDGDVALLSKKEVGSVFLSSLQIPNEPRINSRQQRNESGLEKQMREVSDEMVRRAKQNLEN